MSNRPRRSKIELYYMILCAVAKGHRRITHIMYESNMNNVTLYGAIKTLLDFELLIYDEPFYDITRKGFEYINAFDALEDLIIQ